jgi:hypothetical protein
MVSSYKCSKSYCYDSQVKYGWDKWPRNRFRRRKRWQKWREKIKDKEAYFTKLKKFGYCWKLLPWHLGWLKLKIWEQWSRHTPISLQRWYIWSRCLQRLLIRSYAITGCLPFHNKPKLQFLKNPRQTNASSILNGIIFILSIRLIPKSLATNWRQFSTPYTRVHQSAETSSIFYTKLHYLNWIWPIWQWIFDIRHQQWTSFSFGSYQSR